jgi:hypothetical protein
MQRNRCGIALNFLADAGYDAVTYVPVSVVGYAGAPGSLAM